MSKANDFQVGGSHYKTASGREHWDLVEEFNLDYFQGQITKYVMRWKDKNGLQDLQKARHFLDKYIEVATQRDSRLQAAKVGVPIENPDKRYPPYRYHEGSNAFGSEPPSRDQLSGGKIPTSQF